MSTEADGSPRPRRGVFLRAFDAIERAGNRLPDPLVLLVLLTVLVLIASFVAARRGTSASHPGTRVTIVATTLLSVEGLRRLLGEAVKSLVSFPQLGPVLLIMFGFGIAERSGFLRIVLRGITRIFPAWALTAVLVLASVLAGALGDVGIIVLPPLAASLFIAAGRHPLAGLSAAFAGVTGGFGASLFATALDTSLATLTERAARAVNAGVSVAPTANHWFACASAVVLTAAGTLVNHRWVEPRLGAWSADSGPKPAAIDPSIERRALWFAVIALVSVGLVLVALVLPEKGMLRDAAGTTKPVYAALPVIAMTVFLVPGLTFGYFAGTISNHEAFMKKAGEAVSDLGLYLAFAFVAAQLMAVFDASNLGTILVIKGARAATHAHLSGVPLIVPLAAFVAMTGLFVPSAAAKWAIMAPLFVPLFMTTGYSPATAQATFRAGNSFLSMMTPLLAYYPLFIATTRKYAPASRTGTLVTITLPYAIGFGVAWTLVLVAWVLSNLPLGPGAPVRWAP